MIYFKGERSAESFSLTEKRSVLMNKFKVQWWIALFILGVFSPGEASVGVDSLKTPAKEMLNVKDSGNLVGTVISGNAPANGAQEYSFADSKSRVETREFHYPPDYMRREPVLNYPDLEMFHYGNGVKVPKAGTVKERGILINYWHNANEDDLKKLDEKK